MVSRHGPVGRPVVTSHAMIERVAFRRFAQYGFEGTTMDSIATEVGIGRRTLFHYYPSKNDIPWGQFDHTLEGFRRILDQMPAHIPLHESVHRAVLAFNDFPADSLPGHRDRMLLILRTPALQAHSVLRYAEWRAVISQYVARRTGMAQDALLPVAVGQVSLGIALTAYEQWLLLPDASLLVLLDESMAALANYLDR